MKEIGVRWLEGSIIRCLIEPAQRAVSKTDRFPCVTGFEMAAGDRRLIKVVPRKINLSSFDG